MRRGLFCAVALAVLHGVPMAAGQPVANAVEGRARGVASWIVPSTPNGLVPRQAWLSLSSTPTGDIYVGGADHKTNSALFRLPAGTEILGYVGDARAASESSRNWRAGETAEKFHVRPTYHKGRVYVATADYSPADSGYLKRRGFHWYAHDQLSNLFLDLSAAEPGGVAGAHASIFALAVDPQRGVLYAHDGPRGELYSHDITTGRTQNLGRPPLYAEGYYMPGRYLWVNRKGRVYFTLSKRECVQFYDPTSGFGERNDVQISAKVYPNNVFRTGTRSLDGRHVFVSDREGWIWRYDEDSDSFERIGQATGEDPRENSKATLKIRAFNVSHDNRRLYFINDDAEAHWFWEMDLESGRTRKLCELRVLDAQLVVAGYINHCGNDTWDNRGNLYFCTFGSDTSETTRLILTRVDPVRLKVHLGLLPELVEVKLHASDHGHIILARSGCTEKPLEVVLKLEPPADADHAQYARFVIPAGISKAEVDPEELFPGAAERSPREITVIGNGNNYCAAPVTD